MMSRPACKLRVRGRDPGAKLLEALVRAFGQCQAGACGFAANQRCMSCGRELCSRHYRNSDDIRYAFLTDGLLTKDELNLFTTRRESSDRAQAFGAGWARWQERAPGCPLCNYCTISYGNELRSFIDAALAEKAEMRTTEARDRQERAERLLRDVAAFVVDPVAAETLQRATWRRRAWLVSQTRTTTHVDGSGSAYDQRWPSIWLAADGLLYTGKPKPGTGKKPTWKEESSMRAFWQRVDQTGQR